MLVVARFELHISIYLSIYLSIYINISFSVTLVKVAGYNRTFSMNWSSKFVFWANLGRTV